MIEDIWWYIRIIDCKNVVTIQRLFLSTPGQSHAATIKAGLFLCTRAASRNQHHYIVIPSGLISLFFSLNSLFSHSLLRFGYEVPTDKEFISVCSFYFFPDLISFFCFYLKFFISIYLHISFIFFSQFLLSSLQISLFFICFHPFAVFFCCFVLSWWWICFEDLFWGFFGNEAFGNIDACTFSGIVK